MRPFTARQLARMAAAEPCCFGCVSLGELTIGDAIKELSSKQPKAPRLADTWADATEGRLPSSAKDYYAGDQAGFIKSQQDRSAVENAMTNAHLECMRRGECPQGYGLPKWMKTVADGLHTAVKYFSDHDPVGHFFMQLMRGVRFDKALYDAGKLVRDTVVEVGPWIQLVASCIPGFGTAVSVALGAAIAICKGEGMASALMSACIGAIPGGPLMQAPFKAAAAFIDALIRNRGKKFDIAALEAIRAALPNDAARMVFDAAIVTYGAMKAKNDARLREQMEVFSTPVELDEKGAAGIASLNTLAQAQAERAAQLASGVKAQLAAKRTASLAAQRARNALATKRTMSIAAQRAQAPPSPSSSSSVLLPLVAIGGLAAVALYL